jgi:hypothetical protein
MQDEREETEGGPLVRNAADSSQVRDARKKVRQSAKREREQLRAVLATEAGRAVLWRVVDHCHAFSTALGATDAITNFNVGRQDVGHFLIAQITEASPDAFLTMMRAHLPEPAE